MVKLNYRRRIIAEMAVFNVAGYLIEERCRWPVITASSRGQYLMTSSSFLDNVNSYKINKEIEYSSLH